MSDMYDNNKIDETDEIGTGDSQKKRRFGRKKNKSTSADNIGESDSAQTTYDLSKLKKKELLEIMLAQSMEIDRLRERVTELEEQLDNREFEFTKIGSIAEASLAVTNIFKEAEEAARIYLENVRRAYEKRSK